MSIQPSKTKITQYDKIPEGEGEILEILEMLYSWSFFARFSHKDKK